MDQRGRLPSANRHSCFRINNQPSSEVKTKPIPDGYHTVTPYLIVDGAARAIEFYVRAFNAKESMRMPGPGDKIMHAEIKIGTSPIMLADEFPKSNALSPKSTGGSPVILMLYVEDVDALFAQALAAGARVERAVQDQFYGDRTCTVIDPFGHRWTIATHIEDVSRDEIDRRAAAMKAGAVQA